MAAVLGFALPAAAHTPVMLDSTDARPVTGPLALNGDNPISFFGVLHHPGDHRGFQFRMRPGLTVNLLTLVPDLDPENQLTEETLPLIVITDPSRQVTVVRPTLRIPVPVPEVNQNYLLINSHLTPAVEGIYSVVVTGLAPCRFNVSIGTEGGPFDGIERGTVASVDQLLEWYATPP
jgi:hypothetical protein